VTKQIHHSPQLLALVEKEGGKGMPQVMESHPVQAGGRPRYVKPPVDIPGLERRSELGREHEVVLDPCWPHE